MDHGAPTELGSPSRPPSYQHRVPPRLAQSYGLPTDGSADFTDPDADGLNTWQEWRCQTDPTNVLSALRLLSASRAGTNVTVTWQSLAGVNYFLERSMNLSASPPSTLLAPNLPGQPGTTSFTDTNAATAPRLFYRVGVGNRKHVHRRQRRKQSGRDEEGVLRSLRLPL